MSVGQIPASGQSLVAHDHKTHRQRAQPPKRFEQDRQTLVAPVVANDKNDEFTLGDFEICASLGSKFSPPNRVKNAMINSETDYLHSVSGAVEALDFISGLS
jgi:hypothetical protein